MLDAIWLDREGLAFVPGESLVAEAYYLSRTHRAYDFREILFAQRSLLDKDATSHIRILLKHIVEAQGVEHPLGGGAVCAGYAIIDL